jgi:heat-inducible transcriptional repressor
VDELMQDYRLSIDETKSMHLAFEEKMQKVDRVMDQVAKLVSQATDLPAITMASHRGGCTVKRYDLILAGAGSVILVLMLSNEEITNKLIKLPVNLAETDLQILGAVINAALTQLTAEEFTPERMEQVMRAAGSAAVLVPVIVEFALQTLRRQQEADIRVAGHMRLLGQPEYRDVEKAQKVLSTLDGDMITNLPAVMNSGNGTKVLVGPENVASELKDTSVVMTKFDIGDGMHGMIGVVGPTRMDYAKVTARLSFFAENLSKLFSKNEQMTLPSGGDDAPDASGATKEEA